MNTQPNVVVVTGASSGFGNLTARALAEAGHIVYASTRATTGRNAPAAHAGTPADTTRATQYDGPYGRLRDTMTTALSDIFPPGHEAAEVADDIVCVIGLPHGERPVRTHIHPSREGSEVVSVVYDRIRAEFFHRIGIDELLTSRASL